MAIVAEGAPAEASCGSDEPVSSSMEGSNMLANERKLR